jgi:hypothetical protein
MFVNIGVSTVTLNNTDLYTDQYIVLLFNTTAVAPIFTKTCILQFILYLYNVL